LAIIVLLPVLAKLFAEVFITVVNKYRQMRQKPGNGRSMTIF
jgi:hypothetical protein